MTINFYLNEDKRVGTDKPIYCYLRHKGKTLSLHTSKTINPKYWNKSSQQARKNANYERYEYLNNYLKLFKERIETIFDKGYFAKLTIDQIFVNVKNDFNQKTDKADENFFDVLDLYLSETKKNKSFNTYRCYVNLQTYLLEFQNKSQSAILFSTINNDFNEKFSSFLYDRNLSNNTVNFTFSLLSGFMNYSKEKGISIDYKKPKIIKNDIDIVSLTETELFSLINLDLSNKPKLISVRDGFCFSCFTGLRFSDLEKLRFDNVKDNTLYITTKKTKQSLQIPLNQFALEILSKYTGTGLIFKLPTNAHYLRLLSELCKLAEFNDLVTVNTYSQNKRNSSTVPKHELITSHTARRTFITMHLLKGMTAEVVMKISGHKDYTSFKKYVDITDSSKTNAINELWN